MERVREYLCQGRPKVTRRLATATSAVPPNAQTDPIENFGEQASQLFNERDSAAASNYNTSMSDAARPATREQPPRPYACIDAALHIKLKTTLEFIFVLGWGEFILQYQFNELDDRMSKLRRARTSPRPRRKQTWI